jgi:hypothetical protein
MTTSIASVNRTPPLVDAGEEPASARGDAMNPALSLLSAQPRPSSSFTFVRTQRPAGRAVEANRSDRRMGAARAIDEVG